MNCFLYELKTFAGSMPLCITLTAIFIGPIYLLVRLYNSNRIGAWCKYFAVAWSPIVLVLFMACKCYFPKQTFWVLDALVIDVAKCDCVSDRSGTPQAGNPAEEYSEERGPRNEGDAQKH